MGELTCVKVIRIPYFTKGVKQAFSAIFQLFFSDLNRPGADWAPLPASIAQRAGLGLR
jgi:hypothetical protein